MSKSIKIILIILGIIIISAVFLFYISKKNVPQENESVQENYPPISLFPIPDQNATHMILQGKNGKIETNNLYRGPIENLPENVLIFGKNDNFESLFHPQDQGFVITLLGPNLQTSREEAESDLLQKLGIPKEKACELRVNLAVPAFVDKLASGTNYGLSFCPNGKQLP